MPIYDTYSYRKQVVEEGVSEVFIYDRFPKSLLVQIIQIMMNAIGKYYVYPGHSFNRAKENNEGWELIHKTISREHGVFSLGSERRLDMRSANFLLGNSVIEKKIDLIEFSFKYIDLVASKFRQYEKEERGIVISSKEAISEFNERFKRAGVGYRYESGVIVRIDSEFIHSEIVKPMLSYLSKPGFEGPRDEMMKAYAHYRAGDNRSAITEANNAFESVLKVICDRRNWAYQTGSTVSRLLSIVRENGLFPKYMQNSFEQLAATLKSGLSQIRNEESTHGQGKNIRDTPNHVAAYALHLAAVQISFLSEAYEATK